MAWSSVLVTDLDGAGVGEVSNPYDRSLSFRHNRVTTSHFAVRLDDPLADRLLDMDLLVKLYQDDELKAVHEVTDVEEVVDGASKRLGVTCQDPFWRLGGRLCGKSLDGFNPGLQDRGTAALLALAEVNLEDDTGIRQGTFELSASDYIGPFAFKPVGELIAELAAPLDGFDWRIVPVEPVVDGAGLKVAELNIYAALGSYQPDAVFAYSNDEDDRGNVNSYTRAITKQTMLNTGYSLPPGFPDSSAGAVQTWADATARARWHWREGVIPGDVADDALRLKLVQEHVAVRKNPRETIVIGAPRAGDLAELAKQGIHVPQSPIFGVDYDVGDVVPFRASVDGQTRFDGLVRVYGADLAIDNNGREYPTLTVTPEP